MPPRPTPGRRSVRFLAARFAVAALAPVIAVLGVIAPPFVPSAAAAASAPAADCVLPEAGSVGRIDWDTFRRPVGVVPAVMLFVDFADAPAKNSADTLFEDLFAPEASNWLAQSSYGNLSLQITPVRHWLRMPEPLSSFKPKNGALMGDEAKRYIADAIALADPEVDFSGTQIVMIVPNREATSYFRSSEGVWNPDEGWLADGHVLRSVVTIGSSVYTRGFKVLDHETSHAFGLRDYYPTTSNGPIGMYTGAWSVMADAVPGGDHFAWDKWRMGWLTDSQVRCMTAASSADYVISPLETRGGVKAVVLRTGLQTAVVVEYRTRQGVDAGICSAGVLVYKVNGALAGGAGPIRVSDARPRSAHVGQCGGELDDAAFRAGGRWTDSTSGLTITVRHLGTAARIHVSRTRTYMPPAVHARSIATNVVANADGTATVSAVLTATDSFATCAADKPISLQQWKAGEWWTIAMANTDATGAWAATWMPEPAASYRVLAQERVTAAYACAASTSERFAAPSPPSAPSAPSAPGA